ncbi:hypothetical protein D3C76_991610 [compost metagenome]
MIKIRNEEKTDYEKVEEITRKAFWNLYVLGCDEHYLVHVMRCHKDFITWKYLSFLTSEERLLEI